MTGEEELTGQGLQHIGMGMRIWLNQGLAWLAPPLLHAAPTGAYYGLTKRTGRKLHHRL